MSTDYQSFVFGLWANYVKQAAEFLVYKKQFLGAPHDPDFCGAHVARPVSGRSGQCVLKAKIQIGPYRFCPKHALKILRDAADLADAELKKQMNTK